MIKIGFIGAGNMASAIIKGLSISQLNCEIFVYDTFEEKVTQLKKEYKINNVNFKEVVEESSIIIMAVKPKDYPNVIKEINPLLTLDKIIISIAPSFSIDSLKILLNKDTKIIRAMPNTPALVRSGITGISFGDKVLKTEKEIVLEIFSTIGIVHEIEEKLMSTVVGISGSSPAYAYIFIEALADAGVKHGMPRDLAYEFAAMSLLGSSKMVLETKEHPGKLKDAVASPGGTTIEAIATLEEYGFRNSIIKAVDSCINKCTNM